MHCGTFYALLQRCVRRVAVEAFRVFGVQVAGVGVCNWIYSYNYEGKLVPKIAGVVKLVKMIHILRKFKRGWTLETREFGMFLSVGYDFFLKIVFLNHF